MNNLQQPTFHLTCERCRAYGYKRAAEEKAAFEQSTISVQIVSLCTGTELIGLKTNGMPTTRRKFSFAIVQHIKQQARLELISNVRAGKAVDETVDSHFVQGKSIRRHDWPPRRQLGFESLAVPTANSSSCHPQVLLEAVGSHREMLGEQDE